MRIAHFGLFDSKDMRQAEQQQIYALEGLIFTEEGPISVARERLKPYDYLRT